VKNHVSIDYRLTIFSQQTLGKSRSDSTCSICSPTYYTALKQPYVPTPLSSS